MSIKYRVGQIVRVLTGGEAGAAHHYKQGEFVQITDLNPLGSYWPAHYRTRRLVGKPLDQYLQEVEIDDVVQTAQGGDHGEI